ncbi:hypothetical protein RPMA_11140 [Tardiphaga alba]|uniref:Uncharacterized protein n=1 Tax=Tardiphaga alba TaxID=340268 RepID=A0ABX8A6R7_9BRAD|nr:hypothetical protein [Tardiphaga alba]QUS39327.1 hypothetical protein RPMA_11140 [Tardiphaga alba]
MKTSQKAFVAIAGLAMCTFAMAAPAFAQSAFAGMHGAWSGSGTISLSDGSKERLRCRASYRVSAGDSSLQQSLRCASDSYKFELSSDVVSEGGRVSGSWSETSRGVSGSLQGRASGGRINVVADSPVFTANIVLTTTGNKQSVTITSQGDIRQVSIAMVKS